MSGPALHLLLVTALAAPTAPDPSACAADDFQCLGTAYVAAARLAETGEARALSLYSAHRAFLRLFDRSQDSRDLCQAHELIRQARRVPTRQLGPRLAESERETLSRLRSSGVECGTGRARRNRRPIVVASSTGPNTSTPNTSTPNTSTPGAAASDEIFPAVSRETPELAPVPTANPGRRSQQTRPEPVLPTPESRSQLADRPQVEHRAPVFSASALRPYKPLLIGGGVALGVSLVFGGLSIYYGTTGLGVRSRCIAEPCSETDTFQEDAKYKAERNAYERYTERAWVAGFAGGAALVTAVALLTVGAKRRSNNLALGPMLRPNAGGVVFTGSF